MVAGVYVSRPPCFLTRPCPCKTASIPLANLFADAARGMLMGNRGGRLHDAAAKARRAPLGVAAMDLLRPRIQQSPPQGLGRQLHRIVLSRRGDGIRRRSPALLRMPAPGRASVSPRCFRGKRNARARRDGQGAARRAPRRQSQTPAPAQDRHAARRRDDRDRRRRLRRARQASAALDAVAAMSKARPRPRGRKSTCSRRRRSSPCWRAATSRSGIRARTESSRRLDRRHRPARPARRGPRRRARWPP